jgi:hypothetical protein
MAPLKTVDLTQMSRSEKRNHVLSEKDPISQTQVTMALHEVDALLTALDRTPKQRLWEKYSRASSLYIIVENWDVDMSEFPLRHHNRDFRPGNWDTRSLATLAVLSEFTQGQGAQMGIFLCYAVELRVGTGRLRKDLVVRDTDVKRVVRDLLQPLRDLVSMSRTLSSGIDAHGGDLVGRRA